MNSPPLGSFSAILEALGQGLPTLIVQVVACAVLPRSVWRFTSL
jgi:hypothetical protein